MVACGGGLGDDRAAAHLGAKGPVTRAKAWFLGGGPGAPDLLTVRAARAIAGADLVIWGSSMLMEEVVLEHAQPEAELMPWPPASMQDLLGAYDRAVAGELVVARVIGGDPAIYVNMDEELQRVRELGLAHEIVPGVGALSAAAAALGRQLVTAGTEEALTIASPKAGVRELARHGATLALYMVSDKGRELQRDLLAAGHPVEARCAVTHRLSWPDEVVFTCRLDALGERLEDPGLSGQTLVVVGI